MIGILAVNLCSTDFKLQISSEFSSIQGLLYLPSCVLCTRVFRLTRASSGHLCVFICKKVQFMKFDLKLKFEFQNKHVNPNVSRNVLCCILIALWFVFVFLTFVNVSYQVLYCQKPLHTHLLNINSIIA